MVTGKQVMQGVNSGINTQNGMIRRVLRTFYEC